MSREYEALKQIIKDSTLRVVCPFGRGRRYFRESNEWVIRSWLMPFTWKFVYNIISYEVLAYISFNKLMPVFQSTPTSNHEIAFPFTFSGVLCFTTKAIGSILAIQGVYSMIARLWFVACAWGSAHLSLHPDYLLVPYVISITFHVIASPSSTILLAKGGSFPQRPRLNSQGGCIGSQSQPH
ncbi:hypothetical protein BJX66DRAFT_345964 [Aspergillus keveii]|uniref:Uncharacterized protein n=1 Tax=Aspergillus keveii TaxID=714993 RepID=A0ABR4FGG3_9EURO